MFNDQLLRLSRLEAFPSRFQSRQPDDLNTEMHSALKRLCIHCRLAMNTNIEVFPLKQQPCVESFVKTLFKRHRLFSLFQAHLLPSKRRQVSSAACTVPGR
jgi:hypothetical protein